MKCYKHPDREGTGECVICGKVLCDECQIHLGDQVVCKSCVASLIPADEQKAIEEASSKHEEKNKPKKSLLGFLKRNKEEKPEEKKTEPKTQANVNQYPYGEINNPYTGEVIHEETYDYWDESETPQNLEQTAVPDQSILFESDSYATQSEKPKSRPNIFRRHKMEKPVKKPQTGFEGYVAPEEIVIDHTDDEPSQLDSLFIPEEDEFAYDYRYKETDITKEFKEEKSDVETPKAIVIDHTDDESSQIKDYNPQYEEPELKEEMENIIDRSNEIIDENLTQVNNLDNNAQETITLSKDEIENLIYQLHKEGNSPSKIGIILRDHYNVPNIKAATGQKLTKIIKNKEELENGNKSDLESNTESDMSIASAEESSVIDTEKDIGGEAKPDVRPSLKPFDDINGPQVFNYDHGAPVDETTIKKEEEPTQIVEESPIVEEPKEDINEESGTGEIIIEKTPEELELLKKLENEEVNPTEQEVPTVNPQVQQTPRQRSTTTASSKVVKLPKISQEKQISPKNSISIQNICDSAMFVKSYVDNYSMLPSSVRINHKKWNMSEFLYFAVTSINNISQGVHEPVKIKSLIDVLNTKDDFKFGTITKEDYIFLAKIIHVYIDTEGRAPFERQSTIGILQFRTLVYMFASILTTYKFINQLPETYLVNDNVFRSEDNEYEESAPQQTSQQVIPPVPTPEPTAAAPTPEPTTTQPTTPEPITPAPTPEPTTPEPITPAPTPEPTTTQPTTPEFEETPAEGTPKNLIDELQRNIQDYKDKKLNENAKLESEPVDYTQTLEPEPRIDNGIERTTVLTPEPPKPEIEPPVEDTMITPKKEESPSVSNIKRLMQNSSKGSQVNDDLIEAEQTIEELNKTKENGVGDLKEHYIDNRTRELKEDPHKLTRSSNSPMPKPKEVIRGKKELINDDLKYTPNNKKIKSSYEGIEEYYEEEFIEDDNETNDWLIFLLSFVIFLFVFGTIAYVVYVTYFQATFGTPGEIISNILNLK